MTVTLPLPYEDELLYSVIARYIVHTAVHRPSNAISNIFGRLIYPHADFLCGLGVLIRQTQDTWGLSGLEIVNRHTLLPYHTSFVTPKRRHLAYEAILGDGKSSPSSFLGLAATRVLMPRYFRFCGLCVNGDLTRYGETYWRRSWQLPGVDKCLVHNQALHITSIVASRKSFRHWHDAHTSIVDEGGGKEITVEKSSENIFLDTVMKQSVSLLAATKTYHVPDVHLSYRSRAQELGFSLPNGLIDSAKLKVGIERMFGAEFLDSVGLTFLPPPITAWPVSMMTRPLSAFQPLQHLLLKQFLEQCAPENPTVVTSTLVAKDTVYCPNGYASHGTRHPVEKLLVRADALGRIGRAYCSCGLKFSFRHLQPNSRLPEVLHYEDFGPEYCSIALNLREQGYTGREMAERLGLSMTNIKTLLKNRERKSISIPKSVVLQWREEWKSLLSAIAPKGHKAAQAINRRLYTNLNSYDRDWLRSSAESFITERNKRKKAIRVDWASRDRPWSVALEEAAKKIMGESPKLRRASRTAIISEAQVYNLSPAVLDLLPLCKKTLQELEESVANFQIRRVYRVIRELKDEGSPLDDWRIYSKARIPSFRVTTNLMKVVKEAKSTEI